MKLLVVQARLTNVLGVRVLLMDLPLRPPKAKWRWMYIEYYATSEDSHCGPGSRSSPEASILPVSERVRTQISAKYPTGCFLIVMPGGMRLVAWFSLTENVPIAPAETLYEL